MVQIVREPCEVEGCKNLTKSVIGEHRNTFCLFHTQQKCCMSGEPDSIGRHTCNELVKMRTRQNNCYCIGHWKQHLKKCRCCESTRVKMHRDGYSYCETHMPNVKDILPGCSKIGNLPFDLWKEIFELSLDSS